MVNLPGLNPTSVVTSRAPQSSLTGADIAGPYRQLAENLASASDLANKESVKRAEKAGQEAVGPNGEMPAEKPFLIGDAAEAYSRAARVTALNRLTPEIQNRMTELQLQHQNDPEGFKVAAKAYQDELLAGSAGRDAALKGPVEKTVQTAAGAGYRAVLTQTDATNVQNLLKTSQARLTEINDRSAALARQGMVDTPEYAELHQARSVLYGTLVADPRTGFTRERADQELKDNRDRDVVQQVIGQTVGQFDNEADVRKALDEKFWGKGSENLRLSPQQRDAAINDGVAAFRNRSAEDSEKTQALRETVNGYASNIQKSPGSFDEVAHNNMVEQATAIGDRKSIAALQAVKTMAPLWKSIAAMPLQERSEVLKQMQRGVIPGRAFDSGIVASESSGNPRLVNQLGYAGLYQFGAPRLADIGVYTPGRNEDLSTWSDTPSSAPGKWSGSFHIPGHPEVKTLQDFLANPDAQRAAYGAHKSKMDDEIVKLGLDKYEGKTVGGVLIDRNALYGMMHLGGAKGALNALESGGANAARDANGTSVMDYARKFSGAGMSAGSPITQQSLPVQRLFQSTIAQLREQQGVEAQRLADDLIERVGKGQRPYAGQVEDIAAAAGVSGRSDVLDRVRPALVAYDAAQGVQDNGLQAAATVAQARAAAAGGAGYLERKVLDNVASYVQQSQERMQKDPLGEAGRAGWVAPPNPIPTDNPQAAAAEFADRNRKIGVVQQHNASIGPVKAIGDDEAQGVATALTQGDPQAAGALLQAMQQGLSPDNLVATMGAKPIANALTGMMSSRDPARMTAAMQAADNLWRTNPTQAKDILGDSAITKLQAWQALKDTFTAPELAERMNAAEDPSTAKAREMLKEEADKEVKAITPSDLAYKLGSGWPLIGRLTGSTPSAPVDSVKGGELVADYRTAYIALRTYGVDPDKASELAAKRLQSTWGPSEAAGNQVMKNPPERYYPSIGESHDWIKDDLRDFVTKLRGPEMSTTRRSLEGGVGMAGADRNWTVSSLMSDGQTQAEIAAGRPPSYQVVIKKADGTLDLLEKRVAFDPSAYIKVHTEKLEARRQSIDFMRQNEFSLSHAMP